MEIGMSGVDNATRTLNFQGAWPITLTTDDRVHNDNQEGGQSMRLHAFIYTSHSATQGQGDVWQRRTGRRRALIVWFL